MSPDVFEINYTQKRMKSCHEFENWNRTLKQKHLDY